MPERQHGPISSGPHWPDAARLALVLALGWMAGGVIWLFTGGGWFLTVAALVLPAVILGFFALLLRNLHHLSRDIAAAQARAPVSGASPPPAVQPTLQPTSKPAPAAPPVTPAVSLHPAAPALQPAEEEPGLGLVTPTEDAPVARADLVRALHFPEGEDDSEGFAALRRALGNRRARQLIQAAQDVLTLLSQDGIYTDDLVPDHTRPEVWRRFAQGERGHPVAQLGAIHDRASLGSVMARMREDMIFRDTAHHFLRLFDRILADFEPDASDEELVALSATRTARAFMLIGRAAGVFG